MANSTLDVENSVADLPDQSLRESLIGTWRYSIELSHGGYREEYFTVSGDGKFRLRFVTTDSEGRVVEAYAIVGIWGVAEDILFTSNLQYEYVNNVVYPTYLGDAHEFNAYRILEINDSFQRYQTLGKNNDTRLDKLSFDPCKSLRGMKVACDNQDRMSDPEGSNNGSAISLAE